MSRDNKGDYNKDNLEITSYIPTHQPPSLNNAHPFSHFQPITTPIAEEGRNVYSQYQDYPDNLKQAGDAVIQIINFSHPINQVAEINETLRSYNTNLRQRFNDLDNTTLAHYLANRGCDTLLLKLLGANMTDVAAGNALRGREKEVAIILNQEQYIDVARVVSNYFLGQHNQMACKLRKDFDDHGIYPYQLVKIGARLISIIDQVPTPQIPEAITDALKSFYISNINHPFPSKQNPDTTYNFAHYLAAKGYNTEPLASLGANQPDINEGYAFTNREKLVNQIPGELTYAR